jgi:hypothetical protein
VRMQRRIPINFDPILLSQIQRNNISIIFIKNIIKIQISSMFFNYNN